MSLKTTLAVFALVSAAGLAQTATAQAGTPGAWLGISPWHAKRIAPANAPAPSAYQVWRKRGSINALNPQPLPPAERPLFVPRPIPDPVFGMRR